MSRIVVAGASGFMGRHLVTAFRASDDDVATIGRGPDADSGWDDPARLRAVVEGADVLINLAGRSVNCRYDTTHRQEILTSRTATTRALTEAVGTALRPPRLWLNSSTATIYRHAEDRGMTESAGELGSGFSVEVAKAWESAFFEGDLPSTRRVALRTAIVLGDGSALIPLLRLARLGLGGPQLDGRWPVSAARRRAGTAHTVGARGGRQRFSWVHLDDVLGVIRFLAGRDDISGVVNVASPNPVDGRELMATIRRAVGMPLGLPLPRPALELGAWLLRTETELVLKSRWVIPERLISAGYRFIVPDLEVAIRDILRRRRDPADAAVIEGRGP